MRTLYCRPPHRLWVVFFCLVLVSINSVFLLMLNTRDGPRLQDKELPEQSKHNGKLLVTELTFTRRVVQLFRNLIGLGSPKQHTTSDDVDGNSTGAGCFPEFEWVDWNNYTLMAEDANRTGLGEQGEAVHPDPNKTLTGTEAELNSKYRYNVVLSDLISVERSIGDLRTPACKKQKFIKNIPRNSVSIISVFYNERSSTLRRTLHSIFKRSPNSLLREVILVDDASSEDELKEPLDDYVSKHFPKVKIVRNGRREGLIHSRMIGADASTGKYLVFLDSHMEVNYNYLPPLIEPMVFNSRAIVCPMVDFINADTLMVDGLTSRVRSGFDWTMAYKRMPMKPMDETTPHPTPSMVGCAFAITRRWWEELGKYDPGLRIWSAEQYEISFKSWMCGGSVVDAPCSRIAHLFRPLPYAQDLYADDVVNKNFLRLASVWMDEYKEVVMTLRPGMKQLDPGNLTSQHELRRRLNCKSFKWFLDEVAPDILLHYPITTPPSVANGKIRNAKNSSLCIQANEDQLSLTSCLSPSAASFTFDWRYHIRSGKCFANPVADFVYMFECLDFEDRPTQLFAWDRNSGRIANFYTRLCLDFDAPTLGLKMKECNATVQTQGWTLDNVNVTLADRMWSRYQSVIYQYG
ncbi:polypeptide N-acetylgalactosaminyltransferase 10-like [Physella acuta]|uniref:polypeptide N-acetylgalactosaminyltransferase 10-like n=1 Tax=Physella acuta TaxID=109671 RepID=UPI0027DAFCAB|nr:polypeptide N-acetylgalactosaminyltransferase 10-like [Physella acuta]